MSNKYKFKDQGKLYFVTFSVVYWLDLFIRNEYKNILLDSWRYCISNKGMDLYAWCVMTSHVHLIIGSHGEKLENIMRDMKRYTSQKIRQAIIDHPAESRKDWLIGLMQKAGYKNSNNVSFQLWQQDNHPIELRTKEVIQQKLEYIHNNPFVTGIVRNPEDYLYSSAADYVGKKGLIDITLLDRMIFSR